MFRLLLAIFLMNISLYSTVIEINHMTDILPHVKDDTLVLFDIDETLLESEISLGSSTWRQTMRKLFEAHPIPELEYPYYDLLAIFVEAHISMKSLESSTPTVIKQLKNSGACVMCLTGRAIDKEHYQTPIKNRGEQFYQYLLGIGIDFDQQKPEWALKNYHKGIFFADHGLKGLFLKEQLQNASRFPTQVVFVDDSLNQAQSVEKEMKSIGIETVSFWYRYSALYSKKDFDYLTSAVQLDYLFRHKKLLSEREARLIALTLGHIDPEAWTLDIIKSNIDVLLDFYHSL